MYIILISIAVLLIITVYYLIKKEILSRKLKQLRKSWGKIPEKTLDIESVKIFLNLKNTSSINSDYCIDNDTWNDLNLDEIFTIINRTTTPTGTQCLYYLLRNPVIKEEILHDREDLINSFNKNKNLREKVQLTFQNLMGDTSKYIPYSLWTPLPEKPSYTKCFPFISFISLAVLFLVIFNILNFMVLIPIFIINYIIRSFVKKEMKIFILSFQNLGVLISTAEKVSALEFDEIKGIRATLKKNIKKTKVIAKKMAILQFNDTSGLLEYIKIFFLWDVTSFYSSIDKIEKNIGELREIYEIVGYIDALISVASFRKDFPRHCKPLFYENIDNFIVKDIYNPLLKDPVPNSFKFKNKNLIITGSNMSGKTTFLRTIGANAVLGQTINTVLAEKYCAPFFNVISSIGRDDDIILGKSYYLAEVESILRLLTASVTDAVHLFILDEIFRGTNSVERFAASIEVLKFLANGKDFSLVATHDLELSEKLNNIYQNYHFQEKVCDDGLSFDYKIHPGISTSRNAISLLKYVGYPESIVENAYNRINNTEKGVTK